MRNSDSLQPTSGVSGYHNLLLEYHVETCCSVKNNMAVLCNKFFPRELAALGSGLMAQAPRASLSVPSMVMDADGQNEGMDRDQDGDGDNGIRSENDGS